MEYEHKVDIDAGDPDNFQVVKVLTDPKHGIKLDFRNYWKGRFTKKGIRLNEDVYQRLIGLTPLIQLEIRKL